MASRRAEDWILRLTTEKAAASGGPSGRWHGTRGPFVQSAVSVDESSSTAGSVVTEVSVGLAFSSSHSIGSGLRVSARASTPSLRATGKMSPPLFLLSL